MYVKQDRIGAKVRVEAMLGEAERTLVHTQETYEYYRKELHKATERLEAAQNTVLILKNMHDELEVLATEQKRFTDNR